MSNSGILTTASLREDWFCHCCGLKNAYKATKCRVCGRPESYAQKGYSMPLHGKGNQVYRPSQVHTVMENVMETDANGWTALHTCACSGNEPLVSNLLKLEIDVDALTMNGETALHLASYSGSIESAMTLLQQGAKIDAATSFEKNQPIHIVADRGWKALLLFFLDNGAKPNSLNLIERTPLHLVAANGRVDLASILLKSGANPYLLDVHGWNARQVAELNGHREVEELLVRVTMTEKMAVIKVLPKAPWHGELWSSLLETQKEKRNEHEKEMRRHEMTMLEVAKARIKMTEKAKVQEAIDKVEKDVIKHWNSFNNG